MRALVLAFVLLASAAHAEQQTWRFDNLKRIGDHPVTVEGAPKLVDSPVGKALAFDGAHDSVLIDGRPLVGAKAFTAEVVIRPDGGAFAQRLLHIAETDPKTGLDVPASGPDHTPRLMFEVRVTDKGWALDTYATSAAGNRPLLFMDKLHPLGRWSVVTQTYDGHTYRAYVDGVLQGEGPLAFTPHGPGHVRAGARMNRVDYFQGAIAMARFTDRALKPDEFLKVPEAKVAETRDWPSWGRDLGDARYSPLTQITPQNVADLKLAWTYHMDPAPNASGEGFKPFSTATPLVADGRMYLGTPYHRVVALDPATGKEIWAHELADRDQPALRGVGYWPGDKDHGPRVIVSTLRGRIVALDARTGQPCPDFGNGGTVDTKTSEIMNGVAGGFYSYSAPPIIFENLAILGSKLQEFPGKGPAGDARAWDVITGKLAWTFHSVPRPDEPFQDTWEGDSWKQRSGVNMWNMPTIDAERGVAYLLFSAPSSDRYGGDHKGANLFGNALVAVDVRTGKYLWHFQTVHHDVWDYDLATPPTLLTVMKDGKAIPAVVAMNKTAFLFLLNRETGEPIYPVEERPVPPSSVAAEKAWPTQPFPTKPGIITRMDFAMPDLANVTPEHTAACKAMIDKDHAVGSLMFEPLRADKPIIRFPGSAGGPEWGGGAFDPTLGLYIFNSNQLGNIERLVETGTDEMRVVSERFRDRETRSPCQKPPWGELIAVDVNTGAVAWRSILGVTDVFPKDQQATGRPGNAGPILTAGGVTFVGGTDDHRFRAFETKTGRELWTQVLDYSAHANPITYQGADGRQYVAIVATGGSYLSSPSGGDSLLVYALPK